MDHGQTRIIGWVGERRRSDSPLPTMRLAPEDLAGNESLCALVVVEAPELESEQRCRQLCGQLQGPALVLAEGEMLRRIAGWLPPPHDLASLDDSPEVLQFRIGRLLDPEPPALPDNFLDAFPEGEETAAALPPGGPPPPTPARAEELSLLDTVRREAETDGLTQFYTRRHLDRRLEREFEESRPLSVAMLDLDHFGAVNKQHGWPSGDKVLREACEEIRAQLRETDWVGRYGGEEFCVVMPGASLEQAAGVLERVRAGIERRRFTTTAGQHVPLTVSIGAAQRRPQDTAPLELLERASARALEAKRRGRNQVVR